MGLKVMLIIAVPAAIGIFIISKPCVYVLFGKSFENAVPILKVLSLMIPIVVCNTLLGAQVLVTTNLEKKYVEIVSISAIVNIFLNSIFIPRFGATSAAVASLISEIIVLILYINASKKIVNLTFNKRFLVSIIIPILIYAVIAIFIIGKLINNYLLNMIINIIVCCMLYFPIGLFLKNEAMIFVKNKILKIIRVGVR